MKSIHFTATIVRLSKARNGYMAELNTGHFGFIGKPQYEEIKRTFEALHVHLSSEDAVLAMAIDLRLPLVWDYQIETDTPSPESPAVIRRCVVRLVYQR